MPAKGNTAEAGAAASLASPAAVSAGPGGAAVAAGGRTASGAVAPAVGHAQGDQAAAATVFYDGGCPVCAREIRAYRRQAGAEAVTWVDVSAAPDNALPEGADRDALMRRFTVRRRDGRLVDGPAGFAAVWRALPRLSRFARLLERAPLSWVAEFGYRLFLMLRPLWRRAG
ncbi:MAG: DUF393 domain-containing protein [Pseudomonadota bacterium]